VQSTRVFRALVVADVVLLLAGVAIVFVEPDLPDAVTEYIQAQSGLLDSLFKSVESRGWQLWVYFAVSLAYVAATLASLLGLFFFKRWARTMFAAVVAATLLMIPFMAGTFMSPTASLLDSLLYMCDGAIIAMLFTDPVSHRFIAGPQGFSSPLAMPSEVRRN
jgi:hypothetical protein